MKGIYKWFNEFIILIGWSTAIYFTHEGFNNNDFYTLIGVILIGAVLAHGRWYQTKLMKEEKDI